MSTRRAARSPGAIGIDPGFIATDTKGITDMSGQVEGPMSGLAVALAQHAALPPAQKGEARACYGAFLLSGAAYAVNHGGAYPPLALLGGAGFGLLLLILGLNGPRPPKIEAMTKFWSLAFVVGAVVGVVELADKLPDLWANFYVRDFCIAFIGAVAVNFLLKLRPVSSNAEKLIQQHMNEVIWKPANHN
jgi:hypothetical protein